MKLLTLTSLLFATATLVWAVPSQINYQGRLTDANGDAITGIVPMSLKMYDAPTGGNELYSENIGSVSLDDNGVYSFQFGADGQSVVDVTDTIAVADGTATSYSGNVSRTPLSGSLSVADGTNSWNIVDGNPGVQATASATVINGFVVGVNVNNSGRGYVDPPVVTFGGMFGSGAAATAQITDGAVTAITVSRTGSGYRDLVPPTVTIAPPPTPYRVDYSAETVTVTYESAPTAGTEIVASYEANDSTIVGALTAADTHWLELSINAAAQSPRERVLSVPFAQVAGRLSYENRIDSRIDSLIGKLATFINGSKSVSFNLELDTTEIFVGGRVLSKTFDLSNKYVRSVTTDTSVDGNSYATEIRIFNYEDGERYQAPDFGGYSGVRTLINPYPNKRVASFTYGSSERGHFIDHIEVVSVEEDEQVESVSFGKTLTTGDWIFGFQQDYLLNTTEYDYEFRCVDASGNIFAIISSQGERIRLETDTVCSSVVVVWSAKNPLTVVPSNRPAIGSISFVQAN